jgi:putative transposase
VPRQARHQDQRAARAARLPHSYDHVFDTIRMRTAYRCRAYPDQVQQQMLNRTFGCVRVVWNQTLAARHARWQADRTSTSYAQTDGALTLMKKDPDLAFLGEVSCVPLQQALRHQHQAFTAFFAKRARSPRFKSRRGRQAAHYTRRAFTLRGGELRLAKTAGPLRFTWSWPQADLAALDPTMVVVSRDPDGRWYVTFTIDTQAPEPLAPAGHAVGVDLGVTDFAVTSDGDKIANPRHLARKARNLARYQRRLARCQNGSANRAKAKAKVARAHRKVRDARRDFLHRASTRLVRSADTIVIEDLNVSGMVRNRHLARAISDCGWGEFRRQLAYKCERSGRNLVVIDRWYPSSKTCSACGHRLAELSLGTRQWTCPSCGARHDRDLNAAQNILAAGQAVTACGAGVRHSGTSRVQPAVKQEPQLVTAGIPVLQGEE